jgi:hypothetical protein
MTLDQTLDVGDERVVKIVARKRWNDTGVHVNEGERYRLHADGVWRDLFILSGPQGYDAPWYSFAQRIGGRWRRAPAAPWFALMGAVHDGRSEPFLIGFDCLVTMASRGSFKCFANDVPGFYWNNFGAVRLKIERLT